MTLPIALIEMLDRDGHVRQSQAVAAWPLRVGRAIDNDFVLDDPHTAPYHFLVAADGGGAYVEAGASLNGLRAGARHLSAGERFRVGDQALRLVAGDTTLRLRLAEHALAPELVLGRSRGWWRSVGPTLALALLVLVQIGFGAWLASDPDTLVRVLSGQLAAQFVGLALWVSGWSLASKLFTRRLHLGWHLRVALAGLLLSGLLTGMATAAAFAGSWPWLSSFRFVAAYAIAAAAIALHLLGIEPRRPRRLVVFGLCMWVVATGLTLWSNHQSRDQFGEELYLSRLYPAAWRLAEPVPTARFIEQLAPLKVRLDAKAKRAEAGDDDE